MCRLLELDHEGKRLLFEFDELFENILIDLQRLINLLPYSWACLFYFSEYFFFTPLNGLFKSLIPISHLSNDFTFVGLVYLKYFLIIDGLPLFQNILLTVIDIEDVLVQDISLLLYLIDGFEFVSFVLPEYGALGTYLLHVHHADYLEWLLMN